jgi:hypothetical protein
MSFFNECPICDERYYGSQHYCGTAFEVWEDHEDREDAITVYDIDSEEAAKKACEKWDDKMGDGPTNRVVFVCELCSEEEPQKFNIEWEARVVYCACDISGE